MYKHSQTIYLYGFESHNHLECFSFKASGSSPESIAKSFVPIHLKTSFRHNAIELCLTHVLTELQKLLDLVSGIAASERVPVTGLEQCVKRVNDDIFGYHCMIDLHGMSLYGFMGYESTMTKN
jgi:hypothetical protein